MLHTHYKVPEENMHIHQLPINAIFSALFAHFELFISFELLASSEPIQHPEVHVAKHYYIFSVICRYKFSLSEGGSVTPRFPLLNDRMYDNEFESQFYMICDSNKVRCL